MADQPLLDGLHGHIPGFFAPGDTRILGWVKEARDEGIRIYNEDPASERIDLIMDYILGKQIMGKAPPYVLRFVVNKVRKAIRTHVAALTDLRPLFTFKTFNPRYEETAQLLDRLAVMWWINLKADVAIRDAAQYAAAAGSGDLIVEHDPNASEGWGDTVLLARDPRDTLPIRPTRQDSLQTWEGLIIQEAVSPNKLLSMFPEAWEEVSQSSRSAGWGGQIFSVFRRALGINSPTVGVLDAIKNRQVRNSAIPEIPLFRVYLDDRSIWTGLTPKLMGKPGTNWAYMVKPGQRLYPRKRLIVCTERNVYYDGPSQYWHGMYPVSRLKLESWPWQLLGLPLAHDMIPVQNAINKGYEFIFMNLSQTVNRGIIADKNAVPRDLLKQVDTREPNFKLRMNPTMGEGVKLADVASLPPYTMEFMAGLMQTFDDMTETANLSQLMQLRQMPSGDTIEKYYQTLTPGLKLEGRALEVTLREVAQMFKSNVFQFYSKKRRMLMLGDPGKTLEDFDFDPDNVIPALEEFMPTPGPPDPTTGQPTARPKQPNPDYVPELDKNLPRDVRAQYFQKLFTFYVAPNSLLAMHAQEKKLEQLQLFRGGMLDIWTLAEMFEIPNFGAPPPMPLPVKDWVPQIDPMTGAPLPPPMEIRVPTTVTERLLAMQQLGMGQAVSPTGRKASGQAPPELKQKSDGSTTVTES